MSNIKELHPSEDKRLAHLFDSILAVIEEEAVDKLTVSAVIGVVEQVKFKLQIDAYDTE